MVHYYKLRVYVEYLKNKYINDKERGLYFLKYIYNKLENI
jgi:hypothetical protein